jgi:cysteine desulfurase
MERVCFDHLSGTPLDARVFEAMRPWLTEKFAGAGAVHSGGVAARRALERAREQAASLIGATPEEIIFTSSGTEASNLAVKGCALANQRLGKHIVLSAIEHPAVSESVEFLRTLGFESTVAGVDREGFIDLEKLKTSLRDDATLACVHAANHDLGTIQNVQAIGELVGERGIALFVDATFAGGWIEIDATKLGASCVALAPHRFGGPKGVGILYKNRRARVAPMIHGGSQENGLRAGTENIAGIVGAGAACEIARDEGSAWIEKVRPLRARLLEGVSRVTDVRVNGSQSKGIANLLNISVAGLEGEGLALHLDLKGFAITAGAACVTKASKIPASLAAIGVEPRFALGTIILSLGPENIAAEVNRFLEAFPGAVERLREMSPAF